MTASEMFAGPSEAAALMRQHDWSKTSLGAPETWPDTLRVIIPIMLASRFAMRVLWGPEMLLLYNDAYRPVLGAKHPSAMGGRTEAIYAEIWDLVGPLFRRVYAGEAIALEDTMLPLDRNGYVEEAYFALSYSPIPDDRGVIGGVLGVVYETTDRVLAERRLRTMRELSAARATTTEDACTAAIRVLADNPKDIPFAMIYVLERDGARLVAATGLADDHPLRAIDTKAWPRRAVTLLPPPVPVIAGGWHEPIQRLRIAPLRRTNDDQPLGFLVVGINPRRHLDDAHRTFFELATEQITKTLATAIANDDRARLIARERIAEERLRTLFNDAPAAIAVVRGPNHVFELANPLYCQLVGRSELVGRPGREVVPELGTQGVWDIFDRVYETGVPYASKELPVQLARKLDGALEQGYFNFIAQPMRDEHGAVEGVMAFAIEVTELVVARGAERAARAEAERSNLAKDEFLAVVSHELRNPLSAILGWTRMLRTGDLPADKSARALETIERNAVNQAQLIDDLLDVSRIVSGKLRLDVAPLDFSDVLRAAIDSARPALDGKQLRIKTVFDTAEVVLMGDAVRLQQVVWNLLTNAIKFTPKGGSISAVLTRVDSALELVVSDSGPGIDADFLPYVFERFKQADSTTTRKHGGLGLGLAIAKSIVEMHGGTIAARSDANGSSFTVRLPVAPMRSRTTTETPVPVRAMQWESPPELVGLRVLVVDDDQDGREMIGSILEQCGSRVTLAASVADALDVFERERPEVVLSDIGMPGQDGYELIRQIRARPLTDGGSTPAASLTAYAGAEDRRRALLAGFNMHVAKPVEPAELVAVLASLGRFARALR